MATTIPETTPLSEALRLARHGVKIIQLHWPVGDGCSCGNPKCGKSAGKHPIPDDWTNKGTNNPEEIEELWKEIPQANVGVPMGKINGLFAIDVDGQEGMQTLQQWIAEHGYLPATWQVQTGGGGMQLWYKVPEGLSIPNSVKKIGINIDIRGDGGQSVAPGSLHKSGRRYRWAPGRNPDDLPPADPPEWLIEKIREVIQTRKEADLEGIKLDELDVVLDKKRGPNIEKLEQLLNSSNTFREIIEGKRTYPSPSERDLAMANICAINGWTDQEIADYLLAHRIKSGEDEKHPLYYKLTIAKARKWANEQKDREPTEDLEVEPIPLPEKPKVEPFPVDVFPEPIQRFLKETARSIGVPIDFPGVHALVFLGTAIGSTRVLELKPDYQQQANLYVGTVAEPGIGKSPAQKAAFEPILQLQNHHARIYANQMEEYEAEMRKYQVQLAEWKKRKKEKNEEPPREPVRPKMVDIYTTQTTMEALFRILKNNPRGIVIKLDELAGLIQSLNQYKGGKGDDREHYLSMWSGGDLKIDRVRNQEKGELLFIPKTFVAISGNIQPDVLPQLDGEVEDGFIDRFLLSYPDNQKIKEKWEWHGISPVTKAEYEQVFERLFALKPEMADGELKPKVLHLTDRAKRWWEEWHEINAREINDPDFPRRLRGVWRKMEIQLARIALIIHMVRVVCDEADETGIDEISLSRAIQLVKYFKSHARKVYQHLGKSNVDKRIEEVVEWIRQHGGQVTKRDAQRKRLGGCKKASEVEALFQELKDYGYGRIEYQTPPKGGPKTAVFKLFI